MKTQFTLLLFVALIWSLAACSPVADLQGAAQTSTPVPPAASLALTPELLAQLTYAGIYDQPVTLTDGLYQGAPFVEGGASRPTVTLLPLHAFGDLDGDGQDDAVALLAENSGGSGTFVYLAAVVSGQSGPQNVATLLLGDRVRPDAIAIADGAVTLDGATFAEDDPLCCPSLKTRTVYALQGGALTVVSVESDLVADLTGTEWVLREILADSVANQTEIDATITARFADGQLAGSAGCNSYATSYATDGSRLSLGPIATTLMACDEGRSQREAEFLTALAAITRYELDGDTLSLLDADGNVRIVLAPQ